MSMDNGYIVRKNKAGKYTIHHYFASVGYPDVEGPNTMQFDTLEELILLYQDMEKNAVLENGYPLSEYGIKFQI